VEKFENHEFLRLIRDENGIARGIVLMDLFNLKLEVLKADAVVIATGGLGVLFKLSTNSTFCTGAANGRLYQQGMEYANGEFIQIHPTAIPGIDKLRLMSESARGEGGRVWVYGDATKTITTPEGNTVPCGETGKPWYFLEDLYPAFGNLVPRDIGAREILRICEKGLGIDGKMQVYLDITHLSEETKNKLAAILEIYEKFTGDDPRKVPMRIFPGVHYTMGGGWVDWPAADDPDRWERYRQMTNIPGCFNIGESDFSYHGANRLGANALLSCIYSGLVAGVEVPRYIDDLPTTEVSEKVYEAALELEKSFKKDLMSRNGPENIYKLHDELAEMMVNNATVKRNNEDLKKTLEGIKEIRKRYQNITIDDKSRFANKSYTFAHQFDAMLDLSLIIVKGALLRDEFRGAHYKEGFKERDDKNWLKHTIATYDSSKDEPVISYHRRLDLRHLDPLPRDYVSAKKVKPQLSNVPQNIQLPI